MTCPVPSALSTLRLKECILIIKGLTKRRLEDVSFYDILSQHRKDMEAEREELTDDDPLREAEPLAASLSIGAWDRVHNQLFVDTQHHERRYLTNIQALRVHLFLPSTPSNQAHVRYTSVQRLIYIRTV